MTLATIAFWGCAALLAWVYIGYPLLARTFAHLRPVHARADLPWPPLVTVGVAVHNAAGQLDDRLRNILEQRPPFAVDIVVASDGSSDTTTEVGRQLAARIPSLRVLDLPRVGQSTAQAEICAASKADVVVLTDIETRFAPGCLEALVAALRDERIGCATGVLRWSYGVDSQTASHEGAYWRYEQHIRAWESRAGWLTAATGAVMAVRRTLVRPVPAHASLDQMLPLLARQDGLLAVVAPAAGGSDLGLTSIRDQLRNRTRIATQGIEANLRMVFRIAPWRSPGAWLAIWSHKLLRWATPFLLAGLILSATLLTAKGEWFYAVVLGASTIGVALATIGYFGRNSRRSVPLSGFALTLVAINLAFLAGWLNVVTRRRQRSWDG